jgi:hypothetical protein
MIGDHKGMGECVFYSRHARALIGGVIDCQGFGQLAASFVVKRDSSLILYLVFAAMVP